MKVDTDVRSHVYQERMRKYTRDPQCALLSPMVIPLLVIWQCKSLS